MNTASAVDCQRENEEISEKERLERATARLSSACGRYLSPSLCSAVWSQWHYRLQAMSLRPRHLQGADTFTALLLFAPLPIIWLAERIWARRKDWLLSPKEYAEDCFWLFTGFFIWVPLFTDYYTPLSRMHLNGLATSRLFLFHSRQQLYPG